MEFIEMGGYFPLELRRGFSFFQNIPSNYIREVNTGRTAIWYALCSMEVKKVLVPFFYCPEVIEMLLTMELEVSFYRIGKDFLPLDTCDEEHTAIILVNYYGIIGNKILKCSENFKRVILDHAHSFYFPPVIKPGVMNVYSCRKFFGVCDGAYLIGKNIDMRQLRQDVSYKRAVHLLKSIEIGTNGAYEESKKNELEIGNQFLGMSLLTKRILENINYSDIARKRIRNFKYLDKALSEIQLLELPDMEYPPFVYPLMLRKGIHKELVEHKIYVPFLWKPTGIEFEKTSFEYHYANHIMIMPIDQRYDIEQMQYLANTVKEIVREKESGE